MTFDKEWYIFSLIRQRDKVRRKLNKNKDDYLVISDLQYVLETMASKTQYAHLKERINEFKGYESGTNDPNSTT